MMNKKILMFLQNRNISLLKIITGVVTFFYCLVPVVQFHLFDNIGQRFNDHYIFVLSMTPFEFMELIYTNTFIPYLTQFLVWLIYWIISYYTMRFFTILFVAGAKE